MANAMRTILRAHLDAELGRAAGIAQVVVPQDGYLRAIRFALGMTAADVAQRLGVTAPAVSQAERSEREGTIQLSTLRRVAEAMNCRLVYALVPQVPLEQAVRERAGMLAREELGRVSQTMSLEAQDVEISEERIDELARKLVDRGGLWRL
jgi:predicted DNA-binding mobile mystery protein A